MIPLSFISLLNPKNILIGFVIALVLGAGYKGYNFAYDRGAATIQFKWNEAERIRAEEIEKLKADSKKTEADLKEKAAQQQKAANEKINNLNKHLTDAITGLSNRPDRPGSTDVSKDPGVGSAPGCTGADLFRPDAEFLTREAARAEKLKIRLEECQARYNTVFDKINSAADKK